MDCKKCPYKDENGNVLVCHCIACALSEKEDKRNSV